MTVGPACAGRRSCRRNADRPPLARTASEVTAEGRARPHRHHRAVRVQSQRRPPQPCGRNRRTTLTCRPQTPLARWAMDGLAVPTQRSCPCVPAPPAGLGPHPHLLLVPHRRALVGPVLLRRVQLFAVLAFLGHRGTELVGGQSGQLGSLRRRQHTRRLSSPITYGTAERPPGSRTTRIAPLRFRQAARVATPVSSDRSPSKHTNTDRRHRLEPICGHCRSGRSFVGAPCAVI